MTVQTPEEQVLKEVEQVLDDELYCDSTTRHPGTPIRATWALHRVPCCGQGELVWFACDDCWTWMQEQGRGLAWAHLCGRVFSPLTRVILRAERIASS